MRRRKGEGDNLFLREIFLFASQPFFCPLLSPFCVRLFWHSRLLAFFFYTFSLVDTLFYPIIHFSTADAGLSPLACSPPCFVVLRLFWVPQSLLEQPLVSRRPRTPCNMFPGKGAHRQCAAARVCLERLGCKNLFCATQQTIWMTPAHFCRCRPSASGSFTQDQHHLNPHQTNSIYCAQASLKSITVDKQAEQSCHLE